MSSNGSNFCPSSSLHRFAFFALKEIKTCHHWDSNHQPPSQQAIIDPWDQGAPPSYLLSLPSSKSSWGIPMWRSPVVASLLENSPASIKNKNQKQILEFVFISLNNSSSPYNWFYIHPTISIHAVGHPCPTLGTYITLHAITPIRIPNSLCIYLPPFN